MQSREANAPAGQATPHQQTTSSGRSALVTVFLVVFIDLLGFGIVLPLLPLYGVELLEPLYRGPDNAVLRGTLLGLLMSSFSAMQFLFAPMWGRLSDRFGRRPILLLGLAGSVVFYSLFGIASEIGATGKGEGDHHILTLALVLLFVSRLGAGLAGATIGTAQAVIADVTPPEKRARGMALIGAAFGIGFTFGPLLGFASLVLPLAGAPGYLAAALSLLALVFGLRRLPETRRAGAPVIGLRRQIFDWQGLRRVLATPSVALLVLTFFLATLAFASLESTLALINRLLLTGEELTREQRLEGMTREAVLSRPVERANFLIFAFVGIILMLVQGLIYRRLVPRVGEVRFLRAGLLFMMSGLLGAVVVLQFREPLEQLGGPTNLASEEWVLFRLVLAHAVLLGCGLGVMTLAVVGFALLTPSVQALISRRSDPGRQGEVLGVNQSAAAMARILGPMIGLMLFDVVRAHFLPYIFGAGLLAVVFLLSLQIRHTPGEHSVPGIGHG
jgi:MFS family permease